MKEDINNRFISAINYLKVNNFFKKKAELASNLGFKPQVLTEILGKRMGVQLDLLQNLFDKYNVSYSFIFRGELPIISNNTAIDNQSTKPPGSCAQCEGKDQLIFSQKQTIDAQLIAIDALKKRIEDLSGEDLTSGNNGQKRKVG